MKLPSNIPRGVLTVDDLRERSRQDSATHCWHWLGAMSTSGLPTIYTLDYARAEKRVMSGPRAVWNIAHGRAPLQGWIVMRACGCISCVNPAHHREMRTRGDVARHMAMSGRLKGVAVEQRTAAARIARRAKGAVDMEPERVRLIRSMLASGMSQLSIARDLGLKKGVVNRLAHGKTYRWVV